MEDTECLKRRRRAGDRRQLNIYVSQEVEMLYRIGKDNGWDTPGLVRAAVTKVLMDQASRLQSAPEDKSA